MPDTVEVLESQYDKVIAYLKSKLGFLQDPTAIPDEIVDTEVFDDTLPLDTIKRVSKSGASLSESALLSAYRDLHAVDAEKSLRLMTRRDYYTDSSDEESDNINKWSYNKTRNSLIMRGRDISQGA